MISNFDTIFPLRIALELLKKRAKMTIKSKSGYVSLHYAAWQGFLDIVTLLVENHAEIDPIKYVT